MDAQDAIEVAAIDLHDGHQHVAGPDGAGAATGGQENRMLGHRLYSLASGGVGLLWLDTLLGRGRRFQRRLADADCLERGAGRSVHAQDAQPALRLCFG